ncbi:MAG TPA: hypothetical protein VMO81_12900 [Aestuariivirgaceae bacterium]|nr:hypothetical protein [Aestuariivirgaceae bacterium]
MSGLAGLFQPAFHLVFAGGAWSLDALWRHQDDRQTALERR